MSPMSQSPTPPPPKRTYAEALAAAVIKDWERRPRLRKSGQPFIKTIILDAHLYPESEKELGDLLAAAGLEFECNQIFQNGKIGRQTNVIHVWRSEPE